MKKSLYAVAFTVILAILLSSCGGDGKHIEDYDFIEKTEDNAGTKFKNKNYNCRTSKDQQQNQTTKAIHLLRFECVSMMLTMM